MIKIHAPITALSKINAPVLRSCIFLIMTMGIVACDRHLDATREIPGFADIITSPLPHALKGYELYSWESDGLWYFTLITGTNRLKTHQEITSGENSVTADGWVRINVQGLSALKSLLSRLPNGEEIFWIADPHFDANLIPKISLPEQIVLEELSTLSGRLGLLLTII